jgi:FKBP-type peptidyl-prolyl cis-trans isomerase FkpA
MKRNLLVLYSIIFFLAGCIKEDKGCTPVNVTDERPAMVNFCNYNQIAYSEHSSGILYQILSPGTGAVPGNNSRIYITYTGTLLNGTVFDSQNDPSKTGWYLYSLIDGWRTALPLIRKGGSIKIVVPSSLAYGCTGSGSTIPPNSPLYFTITLVDVQ